MIEERTGRETMREEEYEQMKIIEAIEYGGLDEEMLTEAIRRIACGVEHLMPATINGIVRDKIPSSTTEAEALAERFGISVRQAKCAIQEVAYALGRAQTAHMRIIMLLKTTSWFARDEWPPPSPRVPAYNPVLNAGFREWVNARSA